MDKIEEILIKKDWKYLVKNFLPVNFADFLSFTKAMHLVGYLVIAAEDEMEKDGYVSDLLRDFAVNLMIILRDIHSNGKKTGKMKRFWGLLALLYTAKKKLLYTLKMPIIK